MISCVRVGAAMRLMMQFSKGTLKGQGSFTAPKKALFSLFDILTGLVSIDSIVY